MPYQSVLKTTGGGSGGYQSSLGYAVPQAPSPAQLFAARQQRSVAAGQYVPKVNEKDSLSVALKNLHVFHPDDQVRILQRATQAGLLHKGQAAGLVSGILNNKSAPSGVQNFQAPGLLGKVTAPLINPLHGVMAFGGQVPTAAKTLGQAIISPAQPLINKAVQQGKYLSGATSTQSQRTSILNNQKIPVPQNHAGAAANIQVRKMIAAGAKPSEIQKFLANANKAMDANNRRGLGTALSIASLAAGGGTLAGVKDLAGAARATIPTAIAGGVGNEGAAVANNPNISKKDLGKQGLIGTVAGLALPVAGAAIGRGVREVFQTGAKDFLKTARTNALVDTGREANKPIKVPVSGGNDINTVNVRTPTKVPVGGTSTADKINVRTPVPVTDQQFHSEFNSLSKAYDKETKQLQAASSTLPPQQLKALSDQIEAKYQAKLNDLQDRYANPELSAPVAPKSIKLPKEAPAPKVATTTKDVANIPEAQVVKPSTAEAPSASAKTTGVGPEPAVKVSGSAIKSEQRAVEAKLTNEFENKAGYESGSYKQEASKAVDLVNNDRQKALDIATGGKPGDNTIHEVAVAKALEQKALKEGDVETLTKLAQSSRHTTTSEAAQRLGSEGYQVDPHSPVAKIKEVIQARTKAAERKLGSPSKAVDNELASIRAKKVTPSKQDWHSFVESIKCK